MAVSLTPFQLKAICPGAPASAVLFMNGILARAQSVTHLPAAMVVTQLAVPVASSETIFLHRTTKQEEDVRNFPVGGPAE